MDRKINSTKIIKDEQKNDLNDIIDESLKSKKTLRF